MVCLKDIPVFDNATVMLSHDGIFGFSIAGFLVGLGTKLSNGCTSGHGKTIKRKKNCLIFQSKVFVAYLDFRIDQL